PRRGPVSRALPPNTSEARMSDAAVSPASRKAQTGRGQRVLASLVAGAGFDEIGAQERITPKVAQRIVHNELGRRWIAPAQDYARLQIARLEFLMLTLSTRIRPRPPHPGPAAPLSGVQPCGPDGRALWRGGAREAFGKDQSRRRPPPGGPDQRMKEKAAKAAKPAPIRRTRPAIAAGTQIR